MEAALGTLDRSSTTWTRNVAPTAGDHRTSRGPEVALKPVERLLLNTRSVAFCQFACPADHALFRSSGPCNAHAIVFLRIPVKYERRTGYVIGDVNTVLFYNKGEEYSRQALCPLGSQSDWLAIDDSLEAALAELFQGRFGGDEPFERTNASLSDQAFLAARRMFSRARHAGGYDALALEEAALGLIHALSPLGSGAGARARSRQSLDRVNALREWLSGHFAEECSIADLARMFGVSPFNIGRNFRHLTGYSLHAYRDRLRLRHAVDRLLETPSDDLTQLALELGYSSHSHFTSRFRETFGHRPSELRRHRRTLTLRP